MRMSRPVPPYRGRDRFTLALALFGCTALSATSASAHELEIGGFLGARFFSPNDELGRPDQDPRSPDNAIQHSGLLGFRLSYAPIPWIAVEGEGLLSPTVTRDGSTFTLLAGYRGHLLVHLMKGRIRPFLLAGGGAYSSVLSTNTSFLDVDTDPALHVGAGLKFDLTKNLGLRLDGRFLLTPRIDDTHYTEGGEILLGIYRRFDFTKAPPPPPPKDTDGDGLTDDRDRCPDKAEDLDRFQDEDGCPDPDNDNDGVLDADDKCPQEAGVADNAGCPDTDKDGDGVVDRLDMCPAEPGVAAEKGCPEPDKDKDGVLDKDDKCPETVGPKELGGCPDTDKDGILDKDDKCVDKPETQNGFQDQDGCPDEVPQTLAKFTGVIAGINFKTGKDEIMKPSFKVLDKAIAVLKEFETVRLEISGHTDNKGDATKNKELSQKRADAVKKYLITKGIAEARLVAVGYGPDKPIADNKTKKGQGQNRRVEFKLLSN